MTDERWRQIEQLYHAVLGHTPETCAAFLDDACAGDEQLQTASRYEAAAEFWP